MCWKQLKKNEGEEVNRKLNPQKCYRPRLSTTFYNVCRENGVFFSSKSTEKKKKIRNTYYDVMLCSHDVYTLYCCFFRLFVSVYLLCSG